MSQSRKNLRTLMGGYGGNFEQQSFEEENADATGMSERSGGIINHAGVIDPRGEVYGLIASSVGDININVKRVGATIAVSLPFVLFGSNDFQAKYVGTLRGIVPAGISYTVTNTQEGNVRFTYVETATGNTDYIEVELVGNMSMVGFLAAMNNNLFATRMINVTLTPNTPANLLEFNEVLFFGVLSAMGLKNANQLLYRSRQFSWDYQQNKVAVILPEQSIVPDFSFVQSMIAVDQLTLGFDIYMSRRLNLNKAV